MTTVLAAVLLAASAAAFEAPLPLERPVVLYSYSIPDLVEKIAGQNVLGSELAALKAERPFMQLRHYSFLGPVRTEEHTEFFEKPFPVTALYVFEGCGKLRVKRVILRPQEPLSSAQLERVIRATARSHGEPARGPQPYLSGVDGKWDPVGQLRRLGSAAADRVRSDGKTETMSFAEASAPWRPEEARLWRKGPLVWWATDRELGFGRPVLPSKSFIQGTLVLWLGCAALLLVVWLAVYFTPLFDMMPRLLQLLAGVSLRLAWSLVLVVYPLGAFGWFIYEAYYQGYFS